MKVGILDYGVGNLGSVAQALEELNVKPVLIDNPGRMNEADSLILPGVGSFTACKSILDRDGWTSALNEEVLVKNRPLLGICLGMQLIAEYGSEGAESGRLTKGLGYVSGKVTSLKDMGCKARIPHMGWNSITLSSEASLLSGIPDGTDFYFVHSFGCSEVTDDELKATVDYDVPIAAVIGKGHVWGVQFHPEKSSKAGRTILKNFLFNPM